MHFERLSPLGASALSIWRLQCGVEGLHGFIRGRLPEIGATKLVQVYDSLGEIIDQSIIWRQEKDMWELHMHGGTGVANLFLQILTANGFSKCASTPKVLHATSSLQARCWTTKVSFSEQLASWGGMPLLDRQSVLGLLIPWAKLLLSPPRVLLAGEPNAGKSSLFNAWLQDERCTVSPHPGTTRDAIEATVLLGDSINRFAVCLVDSAGLQETREKLDNLAQQRTHQEWNLAWRVVWLHNSNKALSEEKRNELAADERVLLCINDFSSPKPFPCQTGDLFGSVEEEPGLLIGELEQRIIASMPPFPGPGVALPKTLDELQQLQLLLN